MLKDKLEQEGRAVRHRRLQLTIGIALGLAVLVLAYTGILVIREFLRPDSMPVAEGMSKTPKTPIMGLTPVPPVIPDPLVSVQNLTNTATKESARAVFKVGLAAFQAEIEPRIVHNNFASWDPVSQLRILDAKDQAIFLFSSGSYSEATTALAAVREDAETVLAERDRAFGDAFAAADAAFAEDNYDSASLAIDRALDLRPESKPAAALKIRIDALPALLKKIAAAAVARVENNLTAEASHLAEALNIDPARMGLVQRADEVRRLIGEEKFTRHIADGLKRVDGRDLVAARRSLAAARAIYAGRTEIGVLDEKIAALQVELMIERLIETARAAAQVDDWRAAEQAYVKARRLTPAGRMIADELARAQSINGLDARTGRHLAAPERLASAAVSKDASAIVSAVAEYREFSPRLAARADELATLVKAYAVKVPVRILSDGVTNITVRGVGIVGFVTDRTIELRPGRYTFEGIRAGFQAILIRIDIAPGRTDLVLEIVPNERI